VKSQLCHSALALERLKPLILEPVTLNLTLSILCRPLLLNRLLLTLTVGTQLLLLYLSLLLISFNLLLML